MNERELENLVGSLVYDRTIMTRDHNLKEAITHSALCTASAFLAYLGWTSDSKALLFVWTVSAGFSFTSMLMNICSVSHHHRKAKDMWSKGTISIVRVEKR